MKTPLTTLTVMLFSCVLYIINFRCVSYGILNDKKAHKLSIIVTERKRKLRTGGTFVSSPPPPKKKKAKVVKEEGVDADMQTSGVDLVGSAVL
jgi:hypothetical protein